MRLVESPPGAPFVRRDIEPAFEAPAAFGPGRHYWTMSGRALIVDGRLELVVTDDGGGERALLSAPVSEVEILSKPRTSFGTGLLLRVASERYTLEPEPIYGNGTSPNRIRTARRRVREFASVLAASQDVVRR